MTRTVLPFFNASSHGQGMEGLINYSNILMGYWLIPVFLLAFYILTIYVLSKSEWKMGGVLTYASFGFMLLSWVAQTITQFNQMVIFVFFVGLIAGLIMTFIEGARS